MYCESVCHVLRVSAPCTASQCAMYCESVCHALRVRIYWWLILMNLLSARYMTFAVGWSVVVSCRYNSFPPELWALSRYSIPGFWLGWDAIRTCFVRGELGNRGHYFRRCNIWGAPHRPFFLTDVWGALWFHFYSVPDKLRYSSRPHSDVFGLPF